MSPVTNVQKLWLISSRVGGAGEEDRWPWYYGMKQAGTS